VRIEQSAPGSRARSTFCVGREIASFDISFLSAKAFKGDRIQSIADESGSKHKRDEE